ncbi:MAG TPA: hypothetical protein DDX19_04805 [Rhodopirellula baltica]|uniref:Uncharacterized protein n=1 Tax=Rhodopirellula baltica (strain DSM 10527 / NCIMB 13988 / SH1) TaxID=243090 RepID=Q7UT12_RHOBA|nr:hypothetical protein RB4185 [Rhodopirellula baltica SH 1]HBE62083.1 hypothetical protein [Rhodopirellula baltica]
MLQTSHLCDRKHATPLLRKVLAIFVPGSIHRQRHRSDTLFCRSAAFFAGTGRTRFSSGRASNRPVGCCPEPSAVCLPIVAQPSGRSTPR